MFSNRDSLNIISLNLISRQRIGKGFGSPDTERWRSQVNRCRGTLDDLLQGPEVTARPFSLNPLPSCFLAQCE